MEPAWKRSIVNCKTTNREARTISSSEFWRMYRFERNPGQHFGIEDKAIGKIVDANAKRSQLR